MNILKQNFPTPVALALGSNAAGSEAIFRMACQLLQAHGFVVDNLAQTIITRPVDCPPGTPDFYNSALTGTFAGSSMELLEITQSIEQTLGRPVDHGFHLPRPLDIDMIIFGNEVVDSPRLTLPHPRAQERLFVLEPLNEIAPDWVFPDSGRTVSELCYSLKNPG